MGMQRIDSASEIDPGIIDFSNICCRYRTGVDTTTGSGVYKKHSYRHGVMTKLGDIEITVWTKIVEQLIEKNDEKWLFDVLVRWETKGDYINRTRKELWYLVLELYTSRIFDNPEWIDFISFNRKYRPDALKQVKIITVVNECCGLLGEVTQEQINSAFGGKIFCPHCSRRSIFEIISKTESIDYHVKENTDEKRSNSNKCN